MATNRRHIAWAVAAVAIAAVPLSFFGPAELRLAVIGLLMLAGPGTALVLYLRLTSADTYDADGAAADGTGAHRYAKQSALPLAIAIAVASSLALSTIVATAMVFARVWSPPAAVFVLSLMTLLLLFLGSTRSREPQAGAS